MTFMQIAITPLSEIEQLPNANNFAGIMFASSTTDLRKKFSHRLNKLYGITMPDTDAAPNLRIAQQFDVLLDMCAIQADSVVFICEQGVSRSSAAALYTARKFWDLNDGQFVEFYKQLYNIKPNLSFIRQLDTLLSNPIATMVVMQTPGTKFKKNRQTVVNRSDFVNA